MKPFTSIAIVVLGLIAFLQLLRFIFSWAVTVNGISIPVWASGIVFLITATLAVMLWREGRH